MRNKITTDVFLGCFLILAGATVLSGWVFRISPLVQVRESFIAMVISTAVCFIALGCAACAAPNGTASMHRVRFGLGLLVSAIAAVGLFENLFQFETGLDVRSWHDWLIDGNPQPGSMATNTAIGLLLAGVVTMTAERVVTRMHAQLVQIASFAVVLIGLTGLVSYSIQLDLLFPWFKSTRMAVHTAMLMMLTGIMLWSQWRHRPWYVSEQFLAQDAKITFVGTALMVGVALSTGIAGFAFQQSLMSDSLRNHLDQQLSQRLQRLDQELINFERSSIQLARQLELVSALGDMEKNRAIVPINAAAHVIAVFGKSGYIVKGRDGQELMRHGQIFPDTTVRARLSATQAIDLVWSDGFALHIELPIQSGNRRLGSLIVQAKAPQIASLLTSGEGLGATGESGLCIAKGLQALCFPQYRNPKLYVAKRLTAGGKATPMSKALSGQSGLMQGIDYRGNNVIAAFRALPGGATGMVLKMNTTELFAPLREQVKTGILGLALFIAAGALALRSQVAPLAAKLLRSEQDAKFNEQHIVAVVEGVGDGIITIDAMSKITGVNKAALKMFGYTAAEQLMGRNLALLMPQNMRAKHQQGMHDYLQGGEPQVVGRSAVELTGLRADSTLFPIELTVNIVASSGEKTFVGIVRDITERQEAERLIYAEKERLRVTLGSIGDGVITTDLSGLITYLNPVAEEMTGWSNDEASGLPLLKVFNIIHGKTHAPAFNPVDHVLKNNGPAGLAQETVLIHRSGAPYGIEDSASPIRDRAGTIIGVVLVFHDVSQAQKMAVQMTHQATHDALTGLINRTEFERRLQQSIISGAQEHKEHTMLYLDLDQFKIVNDTCGHMAGDDLLRRLTEELTQKLRAGDTLARLGGDEFGVLLDSCPLEPARRIAEILRKTVAAFRFSWDGKVFPIGVSIGLVTYSNNGITVADILRMADEACYVSKDKGRNRVHVYTVDDAEVEQRRGEMSWTARIQDALDNDLFVLYSQQIRGLKTELSIDDHFEVLVRMVDQISGDIIPPMAFIPAAERYGLMPAIDRWVVRHGLDYCARRGAGGWSGTCAINLSGKTLSDEKFLEFVVAEFQSRTLAPARICFEITETAAITNLSTATYFIKQLRAMGCKFSLDDFGSGMASFGYLRTLEVDYLKIDGSFVINMMTDPIHCAMVEAINHIGQVMGIRTIAEFVQDKEMETRLRAVGVDYAQGYGIQRPTPLSHHA